MASTGHDPFLPLSIENVIRENQWGGVDIRRGGVPVLRSNLICFGYSDGVVVGDEGKGLIEGNTIYGEEPVLGPGVGSSPAWEAGGPGSASCLGVLGKSPPFPGPQRPHLKSSIHLRSQAHRPSQNEPLINHLVISLNPI